MKKKVASTFLAVSLLVGTTAPVLADESGQTQATVTVSSTSSTPEAVDPSSFIYKLKELLAELKTAFIFDDKAKADRLLQKAEQKLSELETLNQTGKIEYNEKFIEAVNEALEKAKEALEQAKAAAAGDQAPAEEDAEDTNGDNSENTELEDTEKTADEVEKHSLAVLKALLDKVPESGKKGIENAIAKQEAKLKEKAEKAEAKAAKHAAKQAAKGKIEQPTAPAPGTNEPESGTEQPASNEDTTTTETPSGTADTPVQTPAVPTAPAPSTSVTAKGSSAVKAEVPALDEAGVKVKENNGLHLGQYKEHSDKDKQEKGKQE